MAPETPRDFISTRDVDRAFLLAAERTDVPRGSVFNIGSGRQTLLREVVEIARQQLGIEAEPQWGSEPQRHWDTAVWVSDPSLAQAQLGWVAQDDVSTGFAALADWMRARPDLWPRFGITAV